MASSETRNLEELGWNSFFAEAFKTINDSSLVPARVCVEHNHIYRIYTSSGILMANTAGRLRHEATGQEALPAVGDWVGAHIATSKHATIREVLPRQSCITRKAAGDTIKQQVIAANIDTLFLVSALDGNFSIRRTERYLAAAVESGAKPVIVLNKTDLSKNVETSIHAIRSIAADVPIHTISCITGFGLKQLKSYFKTGLTVALLGSSGVGKSTIVNQLLERNQQRIKSVRTRDGKGRHTTVHRELFICTGGGLIIDTPGMRELQPWDTDHSLETIFHEVEKLSTKCQFRNCQHQTEPRCAVRSAVAEGKLSASRLKHYYKLKAERSALNKHWH